METEKRRSTTRFMGVHTIMVEGDKYMTRAWVGRLRLHIMYRGDADPDCHDHPWPFWTFPLTPYVEEVIAPKLAQATRLTTEGLGESFVCSPSKATRWRQVVSRFKVSYRPAEHAHRILGRASDIALHWDFPGATVPTIFDDEKLIRPGKIVTIVWRGKVTNHKGWGFIRNTGNLWCFKPWKDYLNGGKHVPCE
jgi:hypothetical protein